jgi:demethylmenaquinone methyltransferase/2-methoxy-6-polyprenyl-1,4-benzoquinol methylase
MGQGRDDSTPAAEVPPHPTLSEYYGTSEQRQAFLNGLFDRTAPGYWAVDRATALGMGLWHRRENLRGAGLTTGMDVLDVACGPGLMARGALELAGPTGHVVGLDPSLGMLREARNGPCRLLVQGVGEQLPFPDARFDFLSMGYALRHVSDLRLAFREYHRVLRPGGIVFLMEISRPRSPVLLSLTRFYIRSVLGVALAMATGNRDMRTLMRYWWDTMEDCVAPETILAALAEAGFGQCGASDRFGGLLRNYRAVKA